MSTRPRWYGSPDRAHASTALDPDPSRSGGQHRASSRPAHFGARRAVLLTVLAAALAVTTGATLVLRTHGQPTRVHDAAVATAPASPLERAAEAWLGTNLPRSTKVIADDTVRGALIDSGFPAAMLSGHAAGCAAISFVVVTRALESAATTDATLAACVRSALPVAVFGSGAAAVHIAETVPAGSHELAAQRAGDAYDRRIAGAALAGNPSVHTAGQVRTALAAGRLDLRAATVIAVLASHTSVRISAIVGDPAEIAAGLPARTAELVLGDSDQLGPVLASLSEPFRPSAMAPAGPHAYRLAWPFTTAPVPGIK